MAQGKTKPRMSEQCQKAAVMVSKAIVSQAAVAAVLEVMLPEGGPIDIALKAGEPNLEDISVSPRLLEAMRTKLVDCMEWSHLAHDRIKEMISHEERESDLPSADQTPRPGADSDRIPNEASIKLNEMPSDLTESESPFARDLSQIEVPASRPQTGVSEQIQQSFLDFLLSDEDNIIDGDEQDLTGVATLGLDSHLNNILSSDRPGPPNVPPTESGPAACGSFELGHQRSMPSLDGVTDAQRFVDTDNRRSCEVAAQDSLRIGSERDRVALQKVHCSTVVMDNLISSEEKLRVEYQEMRPGRAVDKKKGILDDGHQYWKKYGSKNVQHYTFRRGFYKCSVWDKCKATKTVTPTNNNPAVFEIIYEHEHTCSSTSGRSRRRRSCILNEPSIEVIEVDRLPVSESHCVADAEAGSSGAAPHSELCRPINVDQCGEDFATVPANEGAVICETSLPTSTSSGEYESALLHCLPEDEAASSNAASPLPGDDWVEIKEIFRLISTQSEGAGLETSEEVGEDLAPYGYVSVSDNYAPEVADVVDDPSSNDLHEGLIDPTFLGYSLLWPDSEMDPCSPNY